MLKNTNRFIPINGRHQKPQGPILHFVLIIILLLPGAIFSQPNRENWQPPDKIMDIAGVKSGMIVGEVGAGYGYLTFPLAERVGSRGKVYANDISKHSLNRIESRMENENINNIEIILGETEDPLFPEKSLDMVIMVYVFHHLEEQVAFFNNIKKYIKPETPVVIVEQDLDKDPAEAHHFSSKEDVLDVLTQTGYKLDRIDRSMDRDAVYVFSLNKKQN